MGFLGGSWISLRRHDVLKAGHHMTCNLRITFLLALLLLVGCSGLRLDRPMMQTENDWPMFGRTPMRTNATRELVAPPLSLAWEQDISSSAGYGSPIIIDSNVIVTNMRGELYVFDVNSGKRYGWVSLGDAIHGSPVIEGSVAYVAASYSRESLIAYDLVEGKVLWRRDYGDIEVTPLLHKGRLYVGNTAGVFFCVDKQQGERQWSFRLSQNRAYKGIRSSAAVSENSIFFGAEDGTLYCLDASTGREQWSFSTGAPIFAAPAVSDGIVFIGNMAGAFFALDARTGTERWQASTGSPIYAAASFAEDVTLIGTAEGKLLAFHSADGSMRWSAELNGAINSSAVISGNIAYVGTLKKELYALKVQDGSIIWKQTLKGRVKTSPAIAGGKLFIATDDRNLLAFQPSQ